MGKDVEVHVAISCENITLFNKYYAVNLIRLCIRGLAFLGKGSTYLNYLCKNISKMVSKRLVEPAEHASCNLLQSWSVPLSSMVASEYIVWQLAAA